MTPAIAFLAGEGIPVHRYLRRAKLVAPTSDTCESLVPLHQLCLFLRDVARSEGLHDLGFHIAGQDGIESLGSYATLLARAFTFYDSIQISREFVSKYNSGLSIWFEIDGDQAKYCQKYMDSLPRDATKEIEHLGLANALATAGLGRGSDWRPTRIELGTDPIDLSLYFAELRDVPISFNQPHTAVWFDRKWLSRPLPAFDESLPTRAEASDLASFLSTGPTGAPLEQFDQAIESTLGQRDVGLQLTAAIIGVSSRTLQRYLAEHNDTFSRRLQAVRFREAQRLLRDHEMPLQEIAARLSYSDLANFIRAFKRWTGVGPSEFRREVHGG